MSGDYLKECAVPPAGANFRSTRGSFSANWEPLKLRKGSFDSEWYCGFISEQFQLTFFLVLSIETRKFPESYGE